VNSAGGPLRGPTLSFRPFGCVRSFRLIPFFAVQRMETAMQSIKDTYQRITDTIVEQLEAGTKPWIRPWRCNARRSLTPRRATGEPIAASTS
jgi:hypothetical protein